MVTEADNSRGARGKFIAGAVCPSCQAMDRIMVTGSGDDEQRHCVACGYKDGKAPAGGTLPGTRFSKPVGASGGGGDADSVTPVKIIQPPTSKS